MCVSIVHCFFLVEFPAILLNTSTGEIESEFHTYVQPWEHPVLSEFCTELTGITQNQVAEGVPLNICLSMFSKWIQKIQTEKKITFNLDVLSHSETKSCTFVTWSDWDLGVCLHYECKRKQLRKPDILNSWIDLRATYKNFYSRRPKGLNGALQDLGIEFAGREHSGLDDSRNTARLAWRMICDGCMLEITKSLDKVQPKKNSVSRCLNINPTEDEPVESNDGTETLCKDRICNSSCLAENKRNTVTETIINSSAEIQAQEKSSCTSSSTNIHVASACRRKADLCGQAPNGIVTIDKIPFLGQPRTPRGCLLTGFQKGLNGNLTSTSNYNSSAPGSGLVLVSTTISSVNISDGDISTSSDCLSMLTDWEDVALIPESQHEHSSDSVQLKDDPTTETFSVPAEVMVLEEPAVAHSDLEHLRETAVSLGSSKSIVYKSPNTTIYNVGIAQKQTPNCSSFKLPPARGDVTLSSTVLIGKDSTEVPKRKLSNPETVPPAKKQSFTVYEDKTVSPDQFLPLRSSSSYNTPPFVLNPRVNMDQSMRAVKSEKLTPPLCNCGRRARRLNVSNNGPNHGKTFYSCPVGKHEGKKRGCGYFKWEHALLKERSANHLSPTVNDLTSPRSCVNISGSSSHRNYICLRPSMRT
ncbi:ERI1 exoribonuclease 2 isoform X1 [Alligator sinensis]|uniref:ERI1 exoribonuclease 2 n=2 Tax=Alligator sinensis TaxID=38654 RepID=A0A3Q0GSL7_ALLSI|nr:ERI1 exoribonuclease 2 isoform X1 [Alligator sinensis]